MQHSSIVLSPEDEVTITIETGHDDALQEVEAIFDGSHRVTLHTGDKIVIRRSEKTTGIVKLNKVSFLESLHNKMG
jgi:NAD+ kinase